LVVDDFVDNQFLNITMNRGAFYHGDAVALYIHPSFGQGMPFIDHARQNVFYGCDTAIRVEAPYLLFSPTWIIGDFGSQADPGNNTFHCNGRFAHNGGPGSIFFYFNDASAPVDFGLFQGNAWDTLTLDPITVAPDNTQGPWPSGEIFRHNDKVTINTANPRLATTNAPNDCP
jgi:hypothetical protein